MKRKEKRKSLGDGEGKEKKEGEGEQKGGRGKVDKVFDFFVLLCLRVCTLYNVHI